MKIVVLVSGGKDSTAALLLALEQYFHSDVVPLFCDTGWEHELTYEYIDYLSKELSIEIRRTPPPQERDGTPIDGLMGLIKHYNKFPTSSSRFCTKTLKIRPTQRWLVKERLNLLHDGAELWYGIRQKESGSRKRKYGHMVSDEVYDLEDVFPGTFSKRVRAKIKARFPIVDWDADECFYYIESKGIRVNPLYAEGTNDRVGCYPCLLAPSHKQSAMLSTEFGQKQLVKLREVEDYLQQQYDPPSDGQNGCSFCNY
jgi:3'-phosphoadenosine 5'-phosphosulfate sulfotransferase (PAPS reductase)/FAD synthetase